MSLVVAPKQQAPLTVSGTITYDHRCCDKIINPRMMRRVELGLTLTSKLSHDGVPRVTANDREWVSCYWLEYLICSIISGVASGPTSPAERDQKFQKNIEMNTAKLQLCSN